MAKTTLLLPLGVGAGVAAGIVGTCLLARPKAGGSALPPLRSVTGDDAPPTDKRSVWLDAPVLVGLGAIAALLGGAYYLARDEKPRRTRAR